MCPASMLDCCLASVSCCRLKTCSHMAVAYKNESEGMLRQASARKPVWHVCSEPEKLQHSAQSRERASEVIGKAREQRQSWLLACDCYLFPGRGHTGFADAHARSQVRAWWAAENHMCMQSPHTRTRTRMRVRALTHERSSKRAHANACTHTSYQGRGWSYRSSFFIPDKASAFHSSAPPVINTEPSHDDTD